MVVIIRESFPVEVIQSIFYMERDRQSIERVFTNGLVIILHVDKEGLFVRQVVVIFDFVVHFDGVLLFRLLIHDIRHCLDRSLLLTLDHFLRWKPVCDGLIHVEFDFFVLGKEIISGLLGGIPCDCVWPQSLFNSVMIVLIYQLARQLTHDFLVLELRPNEVDVVNTIRLLPPETTLE